MMMIRNKGKESNLTFSEYQGKILIPVILILLTAGLFLSAGCTPGTPRAYRVGIICGAENLAAIAGSFRERMAELGYAEGKNIVYDFQKTNLDPAAERNAIKKFVADNVDLIVAFPTSASKSAREITRGTNIPVVFTFSTIEDNDLVKSVREPGENITGVRFPGPDLVARRFEFLLQIMPGVKRVWVTYEKNYPTVKSSLEVLRPLASSSGIQLLEIPAFAVEDIKNGLLYRTKFAETGRDAILILPETLSQSQEAWSVISRIAAENMLPIAGSQSYQADQGAVFTWIPEHAAFGRMAAVPADKILKGTPAGTIPIMTPESGLRINYKTAKRLGLKIPRGMLRLAKDVIR